MTEAMHEFEQSLTKVKLDMENMNDNLNKVAEAITKMSEANNSRDQRFEELIEGFSAGLKERDTKVDKKDRRNGEENRNKDRRKVCWSGNKDQCNRKRCNGRRI